MIQHLQKFPIIIGPTASGKTALSIGLAKLWKKIKNTPAEIICADSMQIYKGMDIGTATPTKEEMEDIPHHLFSYFDPKENGNVGLWQKAAEAKIKEIQSRNGFPIVCGGSHMYVQALLHGIIPSYSNPIYRKELEMKTNEELYFLLQTIDSVTGSQIHPNDRKRIIRALEVYHESGKSLAYLQTHWNQPWRKDAIVIALNIDKEVLNRRINYRIKEMILNGFEQEVYQFYQTNGLGKNAQAAIGYQEFYSYFNKNSMNPKTTMTTKKKKKQQEEEYKETIEHIKIATRQLAKKQRTWFRKMSIHPEMKIMELTSASSIDLQNDKTNNENKNNNLELIPSVDELCQNLIQHFII